MKYGLLGLGAVVVLALTFWAGWRSAPDRTTVAWDVQRQALLASVAAWGAAQQRSQARADSLAQRAAAAVAEADSLRAHRPMPRPVPPPNYDRAQRVAYAAGYAARDSDVASLEAENARLRVAYADEKAAAAQLRGALADARARVDTLTALVDRAPAARPDPLVTCGPGYGLTPAGGQLTLSCHVALVRIRVPRWLR